MLYINANRNDSFEVCNEKEAITELAEYFSYTPGEPVITEMYTYDKEDNEVYYPQAEVIDFERKVIAELASIRKEGMRDDKESMSSANFSAKYREFNKYGD